MGPILELLPGATLSIKSTMPPLGGSLTLRDFEEDRVGAQSNLGRPQCSVLARVQEEALLVPTDMGTQATETDREVPHFHAFACAEFLLFHTPGKMSIPRIPTFSHSPSLPLSLLSYPDPALLTTSTQSCWLAFLLPGKCYQPHFKEEEIKT